MYRIVRYVVLIGYVGLLSNSINAASNVAGATSSYHHGDFETAMFQFQKIADQSDISQAAQANYMLGKMYERGDGVLIDDQIAHSYYDRAAKSGHADAVHRIQEYGSDESIVQDWYIESAWDGDVDAQYNLGYLFETGLGVQIDKNRAIQWYSEAAKRQHKDAQFRLGLMLISSESENRDVTSGKFWLKAAAENGNEIATAIVNSLFGELDEKAIIQAIRGVRTYDHSSPELMLAVISSALKTNQSLSHVPRTGSQKVTRERTSQKASVTREEPVISAVRNSTLSTTKTDEVSSGNLSTNDTASSAVFLKVSDPESTSVNALDVNSRPKIVEQKVNSGNGLNDQTIDAEALGDETFATYIENQNLGQKNDFFDSRTIIVALAIVLLCGYLWRKQQKHKEKQLRLFSLTEDGSSEKSTGTSNKKSVANEDISTLLERLMADSAAPPINRNAPTYGGAPDLATNAIINADEKQTLGQSSEVAVDSSEVQTHGNKTDDKESIESLTAKLACENFLPMMTSDVVLHKRAAEAALISMEDMSISIRDSHAIDDVVNIQDELPQTPEQSSQQKPQRTLEQTHGYPMEELPLESLALSGLSDLLKQESEGELMDEMAVADSYYKIGVMFARGDGIAPNLTLGARWLQKAADKGHRLAKAELEVLRRLDQMPSYQNVMSAG